MKKILKLLMQVVDFIRSTDEDSDSEEVAFIRRKKSRKIRSDDDDEEYDDDDEEYDEDDEDGDFEDEDDELGKRYTDCRLKNEGREVKYLGSLFSSEPVRGLFE